MNRAQRVVLAVSLAFAAAVAGLCILGVRACFRTSETLWPARVAGVRIEPARPLLDESGVKPDNAYYFLRQLTNLPWRAEDAKAYGAELLRFDALGAGGAPYPLLDTFLSSNSAAFSLWDTAGAVTGCQLVTYRTLVDSSFSLSAIVQLAKATPYRAEQAVARGEWSEAVRIWQGGLRACDHLSRGGTLSQTLVQGAGGHAIARHVRRSLFGSNAPPETVRLMRDFTARLDAHAEPQAEVWRYECLATLGAVKMVYERPELLLDAAGDPEAARTAARMRVALRFAGLVGSTPGRTRSHVEAFYSHVIRLAEAPFENDAFEREFGAFNRRNSDLYLLNDPIGRVISGVSVSAFSAAQSRLLLAPALRRGTAAALAVVLHQRNNAGQPPETLAHLVPAYLAALPADPYSTNGAPLRYRREESGTWRLYSIGANQKDDGGDSKLVSVGRDYASRTTPADLLFDRSLFDQNKAAFERDAR